MSGLSAPLCANPVTAMNFDEKLSSEFFELLIQSTSAGTNWADACTWIGSNVLSGDFVCTFRVETLLSGLYFGVSDSNTPNPTNTWTQIEAAVRTALDNDSRPRWTKNGAGTTGSSGVMVVGNLITFTRSGSDIIASANGSDQFTFSSVGTADMYPFVSSNANLAGGVTLYDADGQLITDTHTYEGSTITTTLSARA